LKNKWSSLRITTHTPFQDLFFGHLCWWILQIHPCIMCGWDE
jgi:hypothetical protein